MRHTTTVRTEFDAAHRLTGHSVCGYNHGHHWTIEVTVEGGLHPKTVQVVDHGELAAALREVVAELDGHDLNDMLPGITPTPEGIGMYVRERLSLAWPRITAVSVAMGPVCMVRIETEIR